jgi:sugar/nucleoside kinase (ribokinase family)
MEAPRVVALGEPLVEIMRSEPDRPLSLPGEFLGPFPSGAPAIFAAAVGRLGTPAGFIGVVGRDDFGESVLRRLQAHGVDTTQVRVVEDRPTALAFVTYNGDGSRHFVFYLATSAAALLSPDDVGAGYARRAEVVHITGTALAVSLSSREACYKAARECRAAGGRVTFDPNIRPELLGGEPAGPVVEPVLELCDVLLPSAAEATFLTGETDERAACQTLVQRGIPVVALKRGKHGSAVFTAGETIEVPSIHVNEVDSTGAGDCYDAGFVVGLLQGWELDRVARFANVVGALSVTRQGPMEGIPTWSEVLQRM